MKIQKDKILHFGVNYVLALTGLFSLPLALGLCIGASLGKEYGDSRAIGNRWDWADIVADLLGMITGLLLVLIIKGVIG